jgi:hypothetical protein
MSIWEIIKSTAIVLFNGWDSYGHYEIFKSKDSRLFHPTYDPLTTQDRIDLAWCEYADWLQGFRFEGPAQDAKWQAILGTYGVYDEGESHV